MGGYSKYKELVEAKEAIVVLGERNMTREVSLLKEEREAERKRDRVESRETTYTKVESNQYAECDFVSKKREKQTSV